MRKILTITLALMYFPLILLNNVESGNNQPLMFSYTTGERADYVNMSVSGIQNDSYISKHDIDLQDYYLPDSYHKTIFRTYNFILASLLILLILLMGYITITLLIKNKKTVIASRIPEHEKEIKEPPTILAQIQTPISIISGMIERMKENEQINLSQSRSIDMEILSRQLEILHSIAEKAISPSDFPHTDKFMSTDRLNTSNSPESKEPEYHLHEMESNAEENKDKEKRLNILIADTNSDVLYYYSAFLSKKYHVYTVNKPDNLQEIISHVVPDIVIANTSFAMSQGDNLCKNLRNSPVTALIPIILFSENPSKEERLNGFRSGADLFLSQLISHDEMSAAIVQFLATRQRLLTRFTFLPSDNIERNRNNTSMESVSAEFINKITDLIYQEMENNNNIIEFIADKLHISIAQLNRRIKTATGMTTSNFILKIKLHRAKQLLLRTPKPIGEIAIICGFSDFAYFSRSFKKEFGMTPTSYQRFPHSIS